MPEIAHAQIERIASFPWATFAWSFHSVSSLMALFFLAPPTFVAVFLSKFVSQLDGKMMCAREFLLSTVVELE